MKHYFVLERETGNRRRIKPEKVDAFFRAIEEITGLDHTIALAILKSGKPIEHPKYRFTSEDVNPFQPADLGF